MVGEGLLRGREVQAMGVIKKGQKEGRKHKVDFREILLTWLLGLPTNTFWYTVLTLDTVNRTGNFNQSIPI